VSLSFNPCPLAFTGFYWLLLAFTGFYWLLALSLPALALWAAGQRVPPLLFSYLQPLPRGTFALFLFLV